MPLLPWHNLAPHVRLVHDYVSATSLEMQRVRIVDHALHFFVDGHGTYQIEGQEHAIKAGTLFAILPGQKFTICTAPGEPFHMLNVHFDAVYSEARTHISWPYPVEGTESMENTPGVIWPFDRVSTVAEPQEYIKAFRQLAALYERHKGRPGASEALMVRGAFLSLLAQAASQGRSGSAALEGPLQEVLAYIQANVHRPISVEELAKLCGYSPDHFSFTFRRSFGLPPAQYIARFRLERARDELLFSDTPIKEIGARLGYRDVGHFTRCFKKRFGLPPARFRHSRQPAQG